MSLLREVLMETLEDRLHGSLADAVAFVERMASRPCTGFGPVSKRVCRYETRDFAWCCLECQATLIKYGPPSEATPEETDRVIAAQLADIAAERKSHESR